MWFQGVENPTLCAHFRANEPTGRMLKMNGEEAPRVLSN